MDIFYPLQCIANIITFDLLNIAKKTALANTINFIIYDTLKVLFLLIFMVFLVSYIQTYITPQKAKKFLENKTGIHNNIIASLVGTVTPFCSCSSVPLFIGFVESRIPLGITFSFLITSPLVNEVAVAILWSSFGLEITLIYIFLGIFIGVIGGYLIGLFKMEKYVADFVYSVKIDNQVHESEKTQKQRFDFAIGEVKSIVGKIWIYVLIGITIGGVFHGFAPENIISEYVGKNNFFAVPIATLIGVPLYSNVVVMIPIIESLVKKGLPIGTALAFLMAVTALSLPEIIILKKVLKKELLAVFIVITTFGIVLVGYLLNAFI